MHTEPQQPARPTRGTVLTMPPRGPQPPPATRQTAPPGHDSAEPADEPGYGHGV
jgi:hypothetical protein